MPTTTSPPTIQEADVPVPAPVDQAQHVHVLHRGTRRDAPPALETFVLVNGDGVAAGVPGVPQLVVVQVVG